MPTNRPTIREPKKGAGVPRETRERNSVGALREILTRSFPGVDWGGLETRLEANGFFDRGMFDQLRMLAREVALPLAGEDRKRLVEVLGNSPREKLRGIAALCVPVVVEDAPNQLAALRRVGASEGIWPRELACTVLHQIAIDHGVGSVLPLVRDWVDDPDPAVRRLVVEGLRPRGVMVAHIAELKRDPAALRGLLERVLDDDADYVRRSVANSLNDISKDNPDLFLSWASEWLAGDVSAERRWILTRALRTLVDKGDARALALVGASHAELTCRWASDVPSRVVINQVLTIAAELGNIGTESTHVVLLLKMDEPGKNGGRRLSSYAIWRGELAPGEARVVSKKIHFVHRNSVPKEPGTYYLTLSVNGRSSERGAFEFSI